MPLRTPTARYQTVGAIAALVQGLVNVLSFLVLAVILPAEGVTHPGNVEALPHFGSFGFALASIFLIASGITPIMLLLALWERLEPSSPGPLRIAAWFTVMASALLAASGFVLLSGQGLGTDYTNNAAAATGAFYAIHYVVDALSVGGLMTLGLGGIAWAWAAVTRGGLSKALSWVVIASGVSGIAYVAYKPFINIEYVLLTVWSLWLGVELWRGAQVPAGAPEAAKT